MKKSKVVFVGSPSQISIHKVNPSESVLIYDRILEKKFPRFIKKFKYKISVKSGEKLKTLKSLSETLDKLVNETSELSKDKLTFVVFGGGSVGDFGGFIASVFKRGCRLIQIPSTWLASIDSAHGGKTALNVGQAKNQIGTFYPADTVFIVKDVLFSQPRERAFEAMGEIVKTLLLSGKPGLKKLKKKNRILSNLEIWKLLPQLIKYKYQIVAKDPYEKNGVRAFLNFGHTVGHVLETKLKISHGVAVHLGLRFAIEFSAAKQILKGSSAQLDFCLPSRKDLQAVLKKIKKPEEVLLKDKKRTSAKKIKFVFLKKVGYPLLKEITVKDLVSEWNRQAHQ